MRTQLFARSKYIGQFEEVEFVFIFFKVLNLFVIFLSGDLNTKGLTLTQAKFASQSIHISGLIYILLN